MRQSKKLSSRVLIGENKITKKDAKRVQAELREQNDHDKGVSSNKHCKTNTNSRGIVRYCSLCKNAGMPESKHISHSDAQCQDKQEMAKRAMYKKECKAVHKNLLQSMKKKHKKLFSLNRKNSPTKEFCKMKRKIPIVTAMPVSVQMILMTAAAATTSTSYPSVTHQCMRKNETKGKNPKGLTREDKSPPRRLT